ncbi:MAG: HDOD domain-containing protein [Gemmatimonadota bacterium]
MRLLLVDDEPIVLSALARLLRISPRVQAVSTATSGAMALEALSADRYDAIITDLQMPGMSGATLLQHVRDDFPGVVRVVLSGCVDEVVNVQLAPLIHIHLLKPCNPGDLIEAVRRVSDMSDVLTPAIRLAVTSISGLPSTPRIYTDLVTTLLDIRSTVHDAGRIIARDDALASKVLQVANSAWLGLAQEVTSIDRAVTYLGATTLKAIVLTVEAFRVFDSCDQCTGFSIDHHKFHSLLTGRIAARIVERGRDKEEAFTAGLLHDIGKLVHASKLPVEYSRLILAAQGQEIHLGELSHGWPSHATTGAELLKLWGLPPILVDAVRLHHQPVADVSYITPALAVHIANSLAHESAVAAGEEQQGNRLNAAVATREDVIEQISEWQEIAASEMRALQAEHQIGVHHPRSSPS